MSRLGFVEVLAQPVFGFFQPLALALGERFAGAIDIEGQHRQGRAEGICLAPLALLRRARERSGDVVGILLLEYARFEIERVAVLGHLLRPLLSRFPWHTNLMLIRNKGSCRQARARALARFTTLAPRMSAAPRIE